MTKLKFLCTCTEPKPCTHERAINEKGVYLKEIIDYVRKDERNKTLEDVKKMIEEYINKCNIQGCEICENYKSLIKQINKLEK
jgi:predicted solute-binding protein